MVGGYLRSSTPPCANKAPAHPVDIFSLAVTDNQILSASGGQSLKVHSTSDADFPLVQSIDNAHTLGCHHIVTNAKGTRAVTSGFAGDVKVWACQEGQWSADATISGTSSPNEPLMNGGGGNADN